MKFVNGRLREFAIPATPVVPASSGGRDFDFCGALRFRNASGRQVQWPLRSAGRTLRG
jgi:hypothetical protein